MSERVMRCLEVGCVLLVAIGAGLAWLPAGFMLGGALLLVGLQGLTPRRRS